MAIQLDVQLVVPDENREDLLLLLNQVKGTIEDYYHDNPVSSPDFPFSRTQPGLGEMDLHYQVVTVPTPLANGLSSYSYQTVDATTATKVFTFPTAASIRLLVAASNAGHTKGLAADYSFCQTLNNQAPNGTVTNDFSSATTNVNSVANSVTLDMIGEAGETIDWKVVAMVVSV